MSASIIAKFRCMSVMKKWDRMEVVEFRPVSRDKGKDPENEVFWDATPSGEAMLTFRGDCGFKPGAYYYIDMVSSEEGDWQLHSVGRHGGGSGDIYLGRNWSPPKADGLVSGSVKMGINYARVVDLFGTPDSRWAVTFRFAEESDD